MHAPAVIPGLAARASNYTKMLLTLCMRPAAIALNYSVKNIWNDIRQKIIIIFDGKSQFNSLVWGLLTLTLISNDHICLYYTKDPYRCQQFTCVKWQMMPKQLQLINNLPQPRVNSYKLRIQFVLRSPPYKLDVNHFDRKNDFWACFLFNAFEHKHNSRGTATLGLHKYQDGSGTAQCCQWEKPKDDTHNTRQVASLVNGYTFLYKNIPRFRSSFHFVKLRSAALNLLKLENNVAFMWS